MIIILSFVTLLSGLALFMVGLKMMSSSLGKLSSKKMQEGLSKVSNNRFASFGFGTLVTMIVQSSTLVTVMTISFLNANLLTLFQAIAIVIGANVGTTFTALISASATFNFAAFLSLFTLIGLTIEKLAKKAEVKRIGQILIGFGLIYMGLGMASSSFKTPEMGHFISNMFQIISFPILLILISALLTALVHSSSLIIGLAIILVSSNTIPLHYALYIVMGANIGTTITGIFAALSGSANGKRLALFQTLFNVSGTFIFTIFVWIFTHQIVNLLINVTSLAAFQVAIFHIIFNLITAVIALVFIKPLEKLTKVMIKDKDHDFGDMQLWYADEKLLKTPSFALAALLKEVKRMMITTRQMFDDAFEMVTKLTLDNEQKISKNEDIVDFLNNSISLYLVKLSSEHLAYQDELEIGKLYHTINDLERIADHAFSFIQIVKDMLEDGLSFSNCAQEELEQLMKELIKMFDLTIDIYNREDISKLDDLSNMESMIDLKKKTFENNHVTRLRTGDCKLEHSKYFYDLTSQLERIGDHLTNIGYSIVSVTGDETA